MSYNLNKLAAAGKKKNSTYGSLRHLLGLVSHEKRNLIVASLIIILNAGINLVNPLIVGYAIDHFMVTKDYPGILRYGALLLGFFLVGLVTSYFQTKLMGSISQRMLFTLRNSIFGKLQELPVAFFNENKAGDLISRINNDSEKINSFFSQSLMQFIGSIMTMIGAGIFLLSIHLSLGIAALVPALLILVFTRLISPWLKSRNALALQATGGMSAEVQESLANFKVIIAFNRRDYFRKRFAAGNQGNYQAALKSGLANNLLMPVYTFFSGLAQLIVLLFGIYQIGQGEFTVGLLVSYIAYVTYFYNPLRQLAALWASFQVAMAGWDRINAVLGMESDLPLVAEDIRSNEVNLMEFDHVRFGYTESKEILHDVSLELKPGKTYALVGPTGGGKTTVASLMARLYDPNSGKVLLKGRDIRTYAAAERTQKIGFILQDPFLFTGTVRDNLLYGNTEYLNSSDDELETLIKDAKLEKLLAIFDQGLQTQVSNAGDVTSLGQKQLIAFMRAVLRKPDLLILDEATANIDTVTEQLLQEILAGLPVHTTRVVIAHRLNTIENADEIYFVNAGQVVRAGSFDDAVAKLMQETRNS